MLNAGYPDALDVVSAFYFLDRDQTDIVSAKEFENFTKFDRQLFESDLREFRRFLQAKFPEDPDRFIHVAWMSGFLTGARKTMVASAVTVTQKEFVKGFKR